MARYWKNSPNRSDFIEGPHLIINPSWEGEPLTALIHGIQEKNLIIACRDSEKAYYYQENLPYAKVLVVESLSDLEGEFRRNIVSCLIHSDETMNEKFIRSVTKFFSHSMKRDSYFGLDIPDGTSEDPIIADTLQKMHDARKFILTINDEMSDQDVVDGYEKYFIFKIKFTLHGKPVKVVSRKDYVDGIRYKAKNFIESDPGTTVEMDYLVQSFLIESTPFKFVAYPHLIIQDIGCTDPKMKPSTLYTGTIWRPLHKLSEEKFKHLAVGLKSKATAKLSCKPTEEDK